MENITNKIKESFSLDGLDGLKEISKYSKQFARIITTNIIDKNFDLLKQLSIELAELRVHLEIENKLERDKNYYLGYIYAYENMARKLIKEENMVLNIEKVLSENPRVITIIKYLNNKKFSSHKELADELKISESSLSNFFKNDTIIKSDIIGFNKIGKSKYYYLTNKGEVFYSKACEENSKTYTEKDIIKLIDAISSKEQLLDSDKIQKYMTIFSEELLNKVYSFYLEYMNMDNIKSLLNKNSKTEYGNNKNNADLNYCNSIEQLDFDPAA